MVAKPGSTRKPLTPEQRAKKPPVSQPIFRRHPINGRYVLYANVGYAMFIDGTWIPRRGGRSSTSCSASRS